MPFYQVPFIRIKQKNDFFYLTKFNIDFLRKSVGFHFREPYATDKEELFDIEKYIESLSRRGIDTKVIEDGVQRRTQIDRIDEISNYINNDDSYALFPSTVILCCNEFDEDELDKVILPHEGNIEGNLGEFRFPTEKTKFIIVDGQHRLAGLLSSSQSDFEMPITLFFNQSLSNISKMFSDINGKQKQVNRSVIYDLYQNIDETSISEERDYAQIIRQLNGETNSPLYKQIKMLGTGKGSVSQAFMLDAMKKAFREIEKTGKYNLSVQEKYVEIHRFFRAIQQTFQNYWPVEYDEKIKANSGKIDKANTQIIKTNGVGAFFLIFPKCFMYSKKNGIKYKDIVSRLKDFRWDELDKGTGFAAQKTIAKELLNISNIDI